MLSPIAATLFFLPAPAAQEPLEATVTPMPQLGAEVAAVAPDLSLSFEALDDLIIWRYGRGPAGEAATTELLHLAVLEHLEREEEVSVSRADLNRRWKDLEAEIVASGAGADLFDYLRQNNIAPDTFRRYLRLAIVHERLTRKALELDEDTEVSGDKQELWLNEEMQRLGLEALPHPWNTGVVVRCGPVELSRDELAAHMRSQLPDEELQDACYELLLYRRVLERLPDISPEAVERAIEAEITRRRTEAESDTRYGGAKYEQLLEAQGLTLEAVRRDPAVRAAALAHLFVDRAHDDADLRAVYESEREFFDGLFGEGVEVFALLLQAARFKNDLVPRDFETAEATLEQLAREINGLEAFQAAVAEHSEDPGTREAAGRVGMVTRGLINIPESMRVAAFEVLDATAGDVSGTLAGPVRIQGGVALLCLGERRPAPTWSGMAPHVHRELRRRFLTDVLPRARVTTWLDQSK